MTTTFKPEDTRPFKYEHARAGAPICCQDGTPVDILKWDMKSGYKIVGMLTYSDGSQAVTTWLSDGSSPLPKKDLVMKPLAYLQGRPVHVGDEIVSNFGVRVKAFAGISGISDSHYKWPDDPRAVTKADRDDFLSMFSENTIREVARIIRGKAGAAIAVEVVLSGIGETADHRIIQAVDTLKITSVTPPPAVPVENKAPENVSILVGTGNPGAVIDHRKTSIDFIDTILPKDFPVKFAFPDSQFEQAAKEALTVPPELLKSDEDPAETAFWKFDGMRKGYGQWAGRPQSERDAFKLQYSSALNVAEHWRQLYEGQSAINAQQADQIRQLTEAKDHLEKMTVQYIEDNAKLDRALDEASTEAGRWMAEAKKLGDEIEMLKSPVKWSSGFIHWGGGKCPVRDDLTVVAMLRNGERVRRDAGALRWDHTYVVTDIIAYKVAD